MSANELYRILEEYSDDGRVSLTTRTMATLTNTTVDQVKKNLSVLIAQGAIYRLAEPIRTGKIGRPAITYRIGGAPSGEVTA